MAPAREQEDYPGHSHRHRSGGRRRSPGRGITWPTALVLVLIAATAAGTYFWLSRPKAPDQAGAADKVAMGSYLAVEGTDTVTVSLGLRNVSTEKLTVVGARFVPPEGLTVAGTAILLSNSDGTAAFDPAADLPASTTVDLAAGDSAVRATVAARFTVDCTALGDSAYGEQIFVTLRQGGNEWDQELAPPVLGTGDEPWLYAAAKSLCARPNDSATS